MSDQAIQIVADENINGLQYFEKLATVKKVRGRQISNDIIRSADALLIRSVTQVNRQLLEQSNVKFIASATSGIDHIDLDYLKKNNVEFAYAPGSNATSVVQYVFACLAQLSKKYDFDWRNKSVGIIGAGHVGGLLASYLEQLDMNFLIYDPLLGHKYAHSNKLTVLDKVLQQDVITVHTPLTWQEPYPTYHMFDKKMLRDFSRDKVLINTSRGRVRQPRSA